MLVELSIENLAIIESLRLGFAPGLVALTGETGTGKSIIIDAVMLLLGGRASAEMVRTGCERATVEGVFQVAGAEQAALRALLDELGLADQGGDLVLRRELYADGRTDRRTLCRVNGRAVTLSNLQEIGGHLIDIHGQGEHLSLLQVRAHLGFLDRYAGLGVERAAFADLVRRLRQVRSDLQGLRLDARSAAQRADLLHYQIQEIRTAALQPQEEDSLRRDRQLLANAEKLVRLAAEAHDALAGGDEGQRTALDSLATAVEALSALTKLDDDLREQVQAAEAAYYQLDELARTLRSYRDQVEFDPARLQVVEERLDLIQRLKRKYGDSIADVLAHADRAEHEAQSMAHADERAAELESEEGALLSEIGRVGQALSAARRAAADRLEAAVEAQLADLRMDGARFQVSMSLSQSADGAPGPGALGEGKRYAFDATGLDRVEFLISANPGEGPKSLVRVASGGEVSRVMLAMKTALSVADPVPTLIFDEIDAGIGGLTGDVVGRKLRALSRDHQVFCVTHLPQIACYADQHYRVIKEARGERNVTTAQLLARPERVEELAVMLGGAATSATRRSAEELLARGESDADPS